MTESLRNNLHGAKLLVVDDDPIFCEFAASVLSRAGAEVIVKEDGAEALEYLTHNHCDLAVIDLIMPKVDGLRLISILRRLPKTQHLPIAVVTSRRDSAARSDAEQLNVALFLSKPIQWTLFARQISGVITESRPSIGNAIAV